eukprot:14870360-Heterocapsa_arctica.AAC.1
MAASLAVWLLLAVGASEVAPERATELATWCPRWIPVSCATVMFAPEIRGEAGASILTVVELRLITCVRELVEVVCVAIGTPHSRMVNATSSSTVGRSDEAGSALLDERGGCTQ